MGNTESNVTSGVKKQAGASMQPIYKLCDLKGKIDFCNSVKRIKIRKLLTVLTLLAQCLML